MKSTINTLRGTFSFFLLASVIFVSCTKEPDLIGLDLLPDGDKLNVAFMDTTTIVAYSIYDEPVRTDELANSAGIGIVGSIFDPVFGKTTTSIYSQIHLSELAPEFGTLPVCDSLVFIMPYVSLFGDTTALQTMKVYELSQHLYVDSVYYSNMNADYNLAALLAQKTFLPRVNDSVVVDSANKLIPQLRLQFNKTLGDRFLRASVNDLSSNANFIQYFKGIAITADEENTPGKGSLVSYGLPASRLRMYYHNATKDSLTFDFVITATAARFNEYNHYGHAGASPEFTAQLSGDTSAGQQKLFIQALGGTRIKLRFPYLQKWALEQNIAINDAQLIMTNADVPALYTPPFRLGIYVVYKDGKVSKTVDENGEGLGFLDGTYNSAKAYRFRIANHIQQLLKPGSDNTGLYLFVPQPVDYAQYNRLVLTGTDKLVAGHMKLAITYTKIPK